MSDLDLVDRLSGGRVDLTYGRLAPFLSDAYILTQYTDIGISALDIFGGTLVKFEDLVERNLQRASVTGG